MSETATLTYNPLPPDVRKPGTVGRIGRNEVRLVDREGNTPRVDQEGEVIARGPTVVDGYWDDADATAEAFVDGWFHTGDLGRFDADGYLTITGRIKDLINRGGEMISPVEVEGVLLGHPDVAEVCVFPIPHVTLGQEVAAAVVPRRPGSFDEAAFLTYSRERLASFKTPRKAVIVNALPRTPNGKVPRADMARLLGLLDLPAPTARTTDRGGTALETAVAGVWASVLGRDAVDRHEDFFLLGGDSLSAVRLLGQVDAVFGVHLSFAAVFDQASTVTGMARCIEVARTRLAGAKDAPAARPDDDMGPIPRRDTSVSCPLSFQQRRLWFIDRLYPGNATYNLGSAIRMEGPLDAGALGRAINSVVARHEALRTTFVVVDGEPHQIVAANLELPLPICDLRELAAAQRESETRRFLGVEISRPFDLERGPLLRAMLLRQTDTEHTLLLAQHHIVTDDWSRGIFHRELAVLYEAFSTGTEPALPPLSIHYPDYAAWQWQTVAGARLNELLRYWRERLAGAPAAVPLPADHPRSGQQEFVGSRVDRAAPRQLVEALFALARQEKASAYFAWLAAFNVFLFRCSNESDIVVGVPVQGRGRSETLGVIGFFLNMLPARTSLTGDPSFREVLGRVRKGTAADLAHQHLPFERMVEELQPARRTGETPLFNTSCILLDGSNRVTRTGWRQGMADFDRGTAPFDLSLTLNEMDDGPRVSFRYNGSLFERSTVDRMMSQFVLLLEGIVADPDRPISEIELMSSTDRRLVVDDWNQSETAYPAEASLQTLFETQVDAFPETISVSNGDARLTYADLDGRANRLAHLLLERGVGPGAVVGVCLERSIEAITAILAVVKAGGAYLPLDPRHPQNRRTFILENARAVLLVTNSPSGHAAEGATVPVVYLDQVAEDVARRSSARPAARTGGRDLAYVIYTSGSTGQPKGVAVPQRGVSRLVINTNYIAFSRDTVVAHVSNPAFDAATFEIWGPLLNGGRVEVFDEETALRPERLATALAERRVTAMFLTAALFHQTAHAKPDAFGSLDTLLVGGDTVEPESCRLVLAAGPPRRLINAYGPTETTTFATYHEVDAVPDGATTIPIGRPIANTRVYVLSSGLQPLPPGITGEVFIGGPGVALGYVNLTELTASRFVADPFSTQSGDRLFKTGDRARYRADGCIELLGRMDRQVKIRGFRVEPAEIERALLLHPHIAEAAVVFTPDQHGGGDFVAYLARRVDSPATASDVRTFLRSSLPDFMIPGAFVWMDRLPLTPNGKVDRSAMTQQSIESRAMPVAPRTATERVVADIWAEHLRHGPVGVDDDFFGLGGHSLLAVKLIAAIEGKCGVSLPLSLLFEAPTVSALARAVDERRRRAGRRSHLISIQPLGAKSPIFALPGGGGSVIAYGLLARALGDNQPFYGLEHPGLDGAEVPPDRVESVAAGFVEDVLRDRPAGPCVLLGACSGAIVAFELARQLEEKGCRVARVIMLYPSRIGDRPGSAASRPVWRRMAPARFVGRRLALYVRQIRSLDGQRRREFLIEKRGLLARLVRQRSVFGDSTRSLQRMRVRESTIAALNTYSPRPYGGAVTLILGERRDPTASETTAARWQAVCRGPMDVRQIGGASSGEMLRPPLLDILVRELKTLV